MAYIKNLKQGNEIIYPVTTVDAVLNGYGDSVSSLLDNLADDIQDVDNTLIVNMTYDSNEDAYACSKTQAQILAAYNDGKAIFARIVTNGGNEIMSGMILPLVYVGSNDCIYFETGSRGVRMQLYADWGDTYYDESTVDLATYSQVSNKANINSPTFTGTPKAPTPSSSDNSTNLATTAFVKTAISGKQDKLVSGTNIKTINNNSIVGSGNLTISASDPTIINDMTSSTTFNQAMAPNVVYIVGSTSNPVTSFTITSLTSTGNDAEYYQAIIYCGSNMSFTRPATVKMGDNRSLPTFFSNTVFEINIFQNILTFTYTDLS